MDTSPYRNFIADRNHAVTPKPVAANTSAPRLTGKTAECGSAWYHDVAIAEAKQAPRKH